MSPRRHPHPPTRVEILRPDTELHLLHAIALALHEVADPDAALSLVLHKVCDTTDWVLGQAWLPTSNGAVLKCSPAWYSQADGVQPFRRASERATFGPGIGLPGLAWATGQPVWSRDVTLDQQLPRGPVAAAVGLRAGMAVPVLAGHDVVAVLEFFVFEQRDVDESLVALVATITAQLGEVLQRKQVEAQLRSSEARLRAIVDTAQDAIITMAVDSSICSFNRGAERIFGYSAVEVVGHPLTRLMPQRFRAAHTAGLQHYLESGEARILGRTVEVVGRRKDDSEVPLELTVSAVPEGSEVLFAGILRDISERKRLEVEREALLVAEQETSRRLRELATLKADFTAMVAHELSAPVAAIGVLARAVASGRLTSEAKVHALTSIRNEVELLLTLVADVRNVATIERNNFDVQRRPIPLTMLLRDAAAIAETLAGGHPIITTSSTDVWVKADPERIGQVLRNLLSNAAKYSEKGTPIEVSANLDGGFVRIAVTDQGPGIHPDDRVRIFEKFGRGRDVAGCSVSGVGLGLYLSRQIVQAHGSQLRVESELGHGSVFSFELEVAQ